MQETRLSQVDSLEKEIAAHSSILAWKNSMDIEAWRVIVHRVGDRTEQLTHTFCGRTMTTATIDCMISFEFVIAKL